MGLGDAANEKGMRPYQKRYQISQHPQTPFRSAAACQTSMSLLENFDYALFARLWELPPDIC